MIAYPPERDGSGVHFSLINLEYIEISCIFASEIKPYLKSKTNGH